MQLNQKAPPILSFKQKSMKHNYVNISISILSYLEQKSLCSVTQTKFKIILSAKEAETTWNISTK